MRHDDRFWVHLQADVERLGVRAACSLHGVHHSAWYRHLRRPSRAVVETGGRDTAILALSRERPAWGCDRIAYFLKLEGIPVSSPTVQKVLLSAGLGRRRQREGSI